MSNYHVFIFNLTPLVLSPSLSSFDFISVIIFIVFFILMKRLHIFNLDYVVEQLKKGLFNGKFRVFRAVIKGIYSTK